nr:28S ribosomal protein S29, mitochondrial [Onthophagus taurus]
MLKVLSPDIILKYNSKTLSKRLLLTISSSRQEKRYNSFRTTETNPLNHTTNHLGQFYRISHDLEQKIFHHGGLPKSFQIQSKTFTETCLMVREPYVDIVNCIKSMDFSKPALRFVLYGKEGSGKTLTMAHLLHYAYLSDFLIVHVPWVGNWMRRCKESSASITKEGYTDINLDAASWLLHFKTQNATLLNNPDFVTSKEYIWSKRESTPKEVSLIKLIDHGISRVKYASDCVVCLAEEIKHLSKKGLCKTFVAIDGFNAFFYPNTRIKTEKKEIVHPSKVVVTEAFLNLTRYDWNNAVCVVTVDQLVHAEQDKLSYLPKYLLGKDGFEHLDPFIPICVSGYSNKEFTSCMDYYRERKWVPSLPGMDEELAFLSNSNPYKLMGLCGPL